MENLFGNVAEDFSKYRSGYPRKFYKKLEDDYNIYFQNQKVLDIATSNGLVARDLVNRGCLVTGIDNSPELINEAKKNSQFLNIDYILGDVTNLPFNNDYFDIVTAVHCWNVLSSEKAISEVFRVLKEGGRFIIGQFDQLLMENNIVSETQKLVCKFNPEINQLNNYGIYPHWIEELYKVGFNNIETFSFDTVITFTHEEWRGRMRTRSEIGGSLSREEVLAFDAELNIFLRNYVSDGILKIPHRMFSIICEK
ncbi:class I SAM-dependent methyltransferase [Aquibacillus albus]|uniref:Ubiquinone/menaquinone biosynthesis C-methylase UbiE n=1 Tax=Aquibacillus albus TaxID=1168171 RepID=A0ABS2MVK2_9BACI|nr:class I SAM-dependent methyltransferase [Aquibacillus albus]MBM7569932.1 ubiquinone/menaquinone biosynthesis C-methylase UbiE [Aquibacillus albus]